MRPGKLGRSAVLDFNCFVGLEEQEWEETWKKFLVLCYQFYAAADYVWFIVLLPTAVYSEIAS